MVNTPKKLWARFRSEVIQLDDYKCVRCGKSRDDGAVLHVHHRYYEQGRKYWDYPLAACETLCAGCHAKEHGIIAPDYGWEHLSDEDLGAPSGICDYCGHSLRYSHLIRHPNWGDMRVGRECSDILTGTNEASLRDAELRKYAARRQRFMKSASPRLEEDGSHVYMFDGCRIVIRNEQGGYRILIGRTWGKKRFSSIDEAKGAAFDAIASGAYREYAAKVRAMSPMTA